MCTKQPDLRDRFIFVTGDSLNERASHFIERTKAPCVYKPFEMKDLEIALYEVIQRTDMETSDAVVANDSSLDTKAVSSRLL